MTDQRDRDEASEQTELAGELERLFEKAVKDAPTPWEVDTLKSEGEYGSGPDTSTGFEVSAVYDGSGRVLFDALNSDAIMVQEDYPDEDGYVLAYDLVSDATAKLVVALVNNLPTILASLRRPTEAASAGAGDPWDLLRRVKERGLPDRYKEDAALAADIDAALSRREGEGKPRMWLKEALDEDRRSGGYDSPGAGRDE